MVNETNRYAEKVIIGLLLHIGIVYLTRISDYWSTDHC